MVVLTAVSAAVDADPRFEDVLAEVIASIKAGDRDKAAAVLREFLRSAWTAAGPQAAALTGSVMEEATQVLLGGLIRVHGRPRAAAYDNRTGTPTPSGFT